MRLQHQHQRLLADLFSFTVVHSLFVAIQYNEVKKMLKRLAEVELQLHRDCCRISEVKSQLCDMYLEESLSKLDETTINKGQYTITMA